MSSASRRLSLLLLSLIIIIIIFFFFFTAAVVSVSAHGGSVHHSNDDEDAGAAGAGEKQPNQLRERGLVLVKIYCLVLVFIGTFAGGISPYFFKWSDGFLVLGTQFAGGVFLGTAMMHFLPDANETFEDLMATSTVSYPFAFMLATVGYMMTMLTDALVVGVYDRRDQLKITMTTAAANLNNGGGRRGSDEEIAAAAAAAAGKLAGGDRDASLSQAGGLIQARSLGDNVLLIIALCFHSVFEGIAIGVAETKDDAWKALWTISLHKIFAAIAMGIALLRMIPNRPFLSCATYAFAFAISSPVGVAIGIIIDATTQGAVADWIYAISMGLACGVFIYVSINHLLAKGYVPEKPTTLNSSFTKFGAVLIGVGVIAVVMIWDT